MALILCSEAGSGLPRESTQPCTRSHQRKGIRKLQHLRITEARWDLRETGREHEECEKLEEERLEEMHEPALLSREGVFDRSTDWRKQSLQRLRAQATPHVKDITGPLAPAQQDFSVQKRNFITKAGSFLTSSLPKPAPGLSYSYCHLIVTMVPDTLIFIFSVLNHLDEFS